MSTPPRRSAWLPFALGALLGLGVGFGAGVASVAAARAFFASMLETERSADVRNPQTLDRDAFVLQTPANWKIDTSSDDYDPDRRFTLESPGSSFFTFIAFDGDVEPEDAADAQVTALTSKVVRDATQSPFARWGAFDGVGVHLQGKLLGLVPGTVRVFAFRAGDQTFTIVEWMNDEDRGKVGPGFELIERSFQAKALP